MIKLIAYEFKKHFVRLSIIAVIIVFSLLSVGKIYSIHDTNSLLSGSYTSPTWKGLYWKQYEDFGGQITDEKIAKLLSIYRPLEQQTADRTASTEVHEDTYTGGNVYTDRNFFLWNFVNPMKYAYEYRSYSNEVVTAAKNNMDLYKSVGNTYEYKKNAMIRDLFRDRAVSSFSYLEMYQFYVQYDFSAFLLLLISLYGLMHVFISEKETDMETLLLTTNLGNRKTVLAKIVSSAIFVCMLCAWFWVVDFIAFSLIFGSWEAASTPLYALEDFINSSIDINLLQYALLSGLIKTLGILLVSLLFLLVSCLFRNALIPYMISLAVIFSLMYMNEVCSGSGRVWLKIINPFILVVNRELFRKTEFVSFFSYPMLSYMAALLVAVIWGALFVLGVAMLVRKNAFRKGEKEHAVMEL